MLQFTFASNANQALRVDLAPHFLNWWQTFAHACHTNQTASNLVRLKPDPQGQADHICYEAACGQIKKTTPRYFHWCNLLPLRKIPALTNVIPVHKVNNQVIAEFI